MKTLKHISLLIIAILALSSCKKFFPDHFIDTIPKLPEATQEGKNTFGCYYNNVLWANNSGAYQSPYVMFTTYYKGYFIVESDGGLVTDMTTNKYNMYVLKEGKHQNISIVLDSLVLEGKHYLNDSLNYSILQRESSEIDLKNIPELSWVEITKLDTANNIISGLFEIQFVDTNGKTIKLTDGRFDLGPR